jgi:uncharacterized protein involved in exopolysaccharide biosynthesis
LEDRKVFLEAQVALLEKSIQASASDNAFVDPYSALDPAQPLVAELAAKKAKLADISARYTERYPEVVRLKQEVSDLEKRIAEARKSPQAPISGAQKVAVTLTPARPPAAVDELRRMKAQLDSSSVEVSSLKKEREAIQKGIAAVEQKIERSPRREQEMISLLRDYDNLKKSYDDLLKKKLEADVAQNLEKRQKGTQFQILDPANLPEEPFKPDRKKVMGIALLLAVALGFGGTIGLEMLDPTLRGVSDFKHYYQIPVLACIPVIQDTQYKRAQSIRRAAVFGGLVTFTTVLSIFLLVFSEKIRSILNF